MNIFINIVYLFIFVFGGSFGVPTSTPNPEVLQTDSDLGIVGGDVAAEGSAPYMVALSIILDNKRILWCGGSLVTTRSVLTAAHCIDNEWTNGPAGKTLRGHVGTNTWNSGGQTYTFARNITYGKPPKHDIALLITATEVTLSKLVQTIRLNYNVIPAGIRSRTNGWGMLDFDKNIGTDIMMEIYMEVLDTETCASKLKFDSSLFDVDTTICAYNSTRHGTCHGDSGSPMVILDESGELAQVGITIRGISCARGYPDVFTKLSYYRHWLEKHIVK